nr:hypothetical protein [uncultured Campylobacter sp.]
MSSLGTKFTSKHLKSSHDTSPYRFKLKFEIKFTNLSRQNPHLENANLKLATLCLALCLHSL